MAPTMDSVILYGKYYWLELATPFAGMVLGFYLFGYGAHLMTRYSIDASACGGGDIVLTCKDGTTVSAQKEISSVQTSLVVCGVLLAVASLLIFGMHMKKFRSNGILNPK